MSNNNLVKTFVDKTVYRDEIFNKSYLNKDDVQCVYYFCSKTESLFKIDKDEDAIDNKIYLNVISERAQKQFDFNKEGIVCVNMKKTFSHNNQISTKFSLRTQLLPNEEVFVQRESNSKTWQRARVIEFKKETRVVLVELLQTYDPKSDASRVSQTIVPFERIAYLIPTYVNLSKAFRVVAKILVKGGQVNFVSGRILDLAKKANKYRYLVFFEGGLTSYVAKKDISIILDQSRGFENFNSFQKEFMNFYFKAYPEVPLAKFKVGDKSLIRLKLPNQTEELYVRATGIVTRVDCKLVQFYAPVQDTHVWLFRGDFTRILSIHNLDAKANEQLAKRHRPIRKVGSQQQKNIIEITIDDDDMVDVEQSESLVEVIQRPTIQQQDLRETLTSSPPPALLSFKSDETIKIQLNEIVPHSCSENCLDPKEKENLPTKGVTIYILPIFFGWRRLYDIKFDHTKQIFYLSPCGIKFYDMETIFDYLQLTRSILQIEMFNLERNFVIEDEDKLPNNKYYASLDDIANDLENQPVSMINTIDKEWLPKFQYLPKREFSSNIKVELDQNFMVCCNCVDDCRNPDKCACQRLTMESSSMIHDFSEFPLKNRILNKKVLTGIYECNNGCLCRRRKDHCVNRNVQLGLRNKLQIFKTIEKGWGVRTLHDIPRGAFICTYAGVVLDDKTADEQGVKFGDTYLADLDLIENLEDAKNENRGLLPFNLDENESDNGELNNLRPFYGEQTPYAINGAIKGNIGRFFNHSCDPNCFAQNVFVDSHDLRFPWLAFFTSRHIPAYTEITWDYSYDIDGVPHKRIDCHCRSENCRGRLL